MTCLFIFKTRNEQLKTQCRLLTSELVKLQEEFNAILNAGDDLQLDYDTLTEARDVLHQDLRVAVAEKNEVSYLPLSCMLVLLALRVTQSSQCCFVLY